MVNKLTTLLIKRNRLFKFALIICLLLNSVFLVLFSIIAPDRVEKSYFEKQGKISLAVIFGAFCWGSLPELSKNNKSIKWLFTILYWAVWCIVLIYAMYIAGEMSNISAEIMIVKVLFIMIVSLFVTVFSFKKE